MNYLYSAKRQRGEAHRLQGLGDRLAHIVRDQSHGRVARQAVARAEQYRLRETWVAARLRRVHRGFVTLFLQWLSKNTKILIKSFCQFRKLFRIYICFVRI